MTAPSPHLAASISTVIHLNIIFAQNATFNCHITKIVMVTKHPPTLLWLATLLCTKIQLFTAHPKFWGLLFFHYNGE